jgi:hypothetical protein
LEHDGLDRHVECEEVDSARLGGSEVFLPDRGNAVPGEQSIMSGHTEAKVVHAGDGKKIATAKKGIVDFLMMIKRRKSRREID